MSKKDQQNKEKNSSKTEAYFVRDEARILRLYKEEGETPLECLERYREENPAYKDVKMTYLGRLDPMAEGILLVLAGDTSRKNDFLDLDKTYEFEVLWGIETDTYDILGMAKRAADVSMKDFDKKVLKILEKVRNKKTQVYPPYSSRTVGGKPLFEWARENRIEEIDVPERSIKIFDINHIHTKLLGAEEILADIKTRAGLVKGDFRQEEILDRWDEVLGMSNDKFLISKFVANVSSGTYIRSLAYDMGKMLDTGALAYSIKRTKIGEYD